MELEIKSKKETPLLSRTRMSGYITHTGKTPTTLEAKELVASKMKAKSDLVAVRHLYPRFGVEKAKVIAHVYNSHDELMKIEDKKTLLKNKFVKTEEELKKEAEAKAAEEAAKAAAAKESAEAPKE